MKYPRLVHDYLKESALLYPEKQALVFRNERYSYAQIDNISDQIGYGIVGLNIQKQDRVIIFLDNSPQIVFSFYGVLKSGGTAVVLNGSFQAPKLSYILNDSGANILITHYNKKNVVQVALQNAINKDSLSIIWVGENNEIPFGFNQKSFLWDDIVKQDIITKIPPDIFSVRFKTIDIDLAALIYTSGSTGEPKGVMSTHQNMISAAKSIIEYLNNTADDIVLNSLPLSFDYGLYQMIMTFMFGGRLILEKSFIFLTDILNKISDEKVTGFPIVPTIISMLLKSTDLNKYDLSTLRYISNTGAALPVEHIKKIRKLLPHIKIYSMFGLTECKRIAYLHPDEIDQRPSSVGKAIPHCEVFIVDRNGKEVTHRETGELVVRGSNVMQGYWNEPELTAKIFKPGLGFKENLLFTGDYFRKDEEGYLYFMGRKDDMIKSRGERISAKEIENVIYKIEGICECAVIGIPDEILGQAIKLFVVRDKNKILTEKDILGFCCHNLEKYAMPKHIRFIDEIPKNANGKVNKEKLHKL